MFINDETVQVIRDLLDSCEHTIRENLILQKMLEQSGVVQWHEVLEKNLSRPEIRAELDEHLAPFRQNREALLKALSGIGDESPPRSGKPN